MATAQFHRMKMDPKDRTKITVLQSEISRWCHNCLKNVCPNVIVTKFLSAPLTVCPHCASVIQANGNGKAHA